MTLSQRLEKIEKELEKVRGCSPLTDGFGTMRYAKKSRKWDQLAKEKMRILKMIEETDEMVDELSNKGIQLEFREDSTIAPKDSPEAD